MVKKIEDTNLEEVLGVLKGVLDGQEQLHNAVAQSLNELTEKVKHLEEEITKILAKTNIYNAIMDTEGVSDDVKLGLIKKIMNYAGGDDS